MCRGRVDVPVVLVSQAILYESRQRHAASRPRGPHGRFASSAETADSGSAASDLAVTGDGAATREAEAGREGADNEARDGGLGGSAIADSNSRPRKRQRHGL